MDDTAAEVGGATEPLPERRPVDPSAGTPPQRFPAFGEDPVFLDAVPSHPTEPSSDPDVILGEGLVISIEWPGDGLTFTANVIRAEPSGLCLVEYWQVGRQAGVGVISEDAEDVLFANEELHLVEWDALRCLMWHQLAPPATSDGLRMVEWGLPKHRMWAPRIQRWPQSWRALQRPDWWEAFEEYVEMEMEKAMQGRQQE